MSLIYPLPEGLSVAFFVIFFNLARSIWGQEGGGGGGGGGGGEREGRPLVSTAVEQLYLLINIPML